MLPRIITRSHLGKIWATSLKLTNGYTESEASKSGRFDFTQACDSHAFLGELNLAALRQRLRRLARVCKEPILWILSRIIFVSFPRNFKFDCAISILAPRNTSPQTYRQRPDCPPECPFPQAFDLSVSGTSVCHHVDTWRILPFAV
jgi:hypothetical protein